jgi:hypothetical protein
MRQRFADIKLGGRQRRFDPHQAGVDSLEVIEVLVEAVEPSRPQWCSGVARPGRLQIDR